MFDLIPLGEYNRLPARKVFIDENLLVPKMCLGSGNVFLLLMARSLDIPDVKV